MLGRILLNPAAGAEGGAQGAPQAAPDPKPAATDAPNLAQAAQNLAARHGDPTNALIFVLNENHEFRAKNRDLAAKLPPEGSIVLQGDDAKHWGAYKGLGSPADLRKKIEEGGNALQKVAATERSQYIATVGKATGFTPDVLGTLVDRDRIEVELRDEVGKDGRPLVDRDGQPVKLAVVKGEGDKVTPLRDYAAKNWAPFLPALKADAGGKAAATHGATPESHRARPVPATPPSNGARPRAGTGMGRPVW